MGCINSKHVARSCNSPIRHRPVVFRDGDEDDRSSVSSSSKHSYSLTLRKPKKHHNRNHSHSFEPLERIKEETEDEKTSDVSVVGRDESQKNGDGALNSRSYNKLSKRFGLSIKFGRSTEGEQVAAGWPAWLSSVSGEATDGWQPLKSENFEKLDKIGEGTYSNVYKARNLQTGKLVALKKIKFDNFQPESVRFMAREIKILRRVDHPNVMKLEGIIASRLSCSIYLVFEYMEHDLAGLLSSPDVKFTGPQIKCYMLQLLKGIEHCHSRGIIHRDIKSSNILVNNDGVLKIADFGLANFFNPRSRQPLTSRVVTLWYRPPELLLGSTNYGPYIDMWSVGCVFAELFIGRPILKGRTEVEQLHKIFKLCGTPSDEYWKKTRLPLAPMFRPQFTYKTTLQEKCKELPRPVIDLIDQLLSIEPEKRATAKSALEAEYFYTQPDACDPESMPKYSPNKEMDAKFREASRRKKGSVRVRGAGGSRNPRKLYKMMQEEGGLGNANPEGGYYIRSRESVDSQASYDDTVSDVSQTTKVSQATTSNGSFTYETKRHTLKRPDSFYEPRGLSSGRQEQERFRHSGPMLTQSQKEYYTRNRSSRLA